MIFDIEVIEKFQKFQKYSFHKVVSSLNEAPK